MRNQPLESLLDAAGRLLREMARSESLPLMVQRLGEWLSYEAARATAKEGAAGVDDPMKAAPPQVSAVQAPPPPPPPQPPPIPAVARSVLAAERPLPESLGHVPLNLGGARASVVVPGRTDEIGRARAAAAERAEAPGPGGSFDSYVDREPDLALIEQRSRLKAESCRLYVERQAAAGDPDLEPEMVERIAALISKARSLPSCFLWVLYRERTQPPEDVVMTIAACYEALAEAAGVARECTSNPRPSEALVVEAMQLLAEASSALRQALASTWLSSADTDQQDAHDWLLQETVRRQVLIPRYMRLDDPADPEDAATITKEAARIRERVRAREEHQRTVNNLVGQVRYHAKKLARSAGAPDAEDLGKIAEALDRLLENRVPPEDRRVREAVSVIPKELSQHGAWQGRPLVLRALAAAALPDAGSEPEASRERQWSERVKEARRLLRGTTAVIVGGERRPEAADRIIEAFELAGLEWVKLTEHGSGEAMRAPIERMGTGVVLLLIKLTGHLHANEAADYARRARKPLVYLKAGYNPEQIAEAVLEQAAVQLRAGVGATTNT